MENQEEKTVFVCGGDPDDILTAVYDAWASRKGHSRVRLEVEGESQPEFFCSYVPVETDREKARKVAAAVKKKIGGRAWQMVYRAALSREASRAEDIYRFLVGGFYYGPQALDMLAEPAVYRLLELSRAVGNEAHFFREFLRFDQRENRILLGRIRPKNNVLSLVMPHFADRLPQENFLILDMGRGLAGVHPAGGAWVLARLEPPEAEKLLAAQADPFRELWKTFHRAIGVEQRKNPRLQQSRMPLRYREFAEEFLE